MGTATDTGVVEIRGAKGRMCRAILADLPGWFGIPQALDEYVANVEHLPVYGFADNRNIVGFIALKFHGAYAAEAYVLGVKRAWHRQGIGRHLFAHVESILRERHVRFFTVKTVGGDDPGPEYAATRKFYEAIGFVPLETFPTLWSPDNPCLLMIKHIGAGAI